MRSTQRRSLLQAFGLGGLFGAPAMMAATQPASASPRRETLVIDVAILGHTNYSNRDGAANRVLGPDGWRQSDLRGTNYYFEGLVYAGGTIPDPAAGDVNAVVWNFAKPPIGSYFNRGWIMINNKTDPPYERREHPHLLSHADCYLGGVVGPDNLSPTDMLQTTGTEHGEPPRDTVRRAVTGGTGRFASVRGEVIQTSLGRNTLPLRGMPVPRPEPPLSPNYRLTFNLWLWD